MLCWSLLTFQHRDTKLLYLTKTHCPFTLLSRKLPDDPKAEWSTSLVSSVIVRHIQAHSVNMVRSALPHSFAFQSSGFSVISCLMLTHNFPAIVLFLPYVLATQLPSSLSQFHWGLCNNPVSRHRFFVQCRLYFQKKKKKTRRKFPLLL